jgi:hypothetical protein
VAGLWAGGKGAWHARRSRVERLARWRSQPWGPHLELCRAPALLLLARQPLLLRRGRLGVARLAAQPVGHRQRRVLGLRPRRHVGHVERRRQRARRHAARARLLRAAAGRGGGAGGVRARGVLARGPGQRGGTTASAPNLARAALAQGPNAPRTSRRCASSRAAETASCCAWRASVARRKGFGCVGSRGATNGTNLGQWVLGEGPARGV